jgi:hypothetical protein
MGFGAIANPRSHPRPLKGRAAHSAYTKLHQPVLVRAYIFFTILLYKKTKPLNIQGLCFFGINYLNIDKTSNSAALIGGPVRRCSPSGAGGVLGLPFRGWGYRD